MLNTKKTPTRSKVVRHRTARSIQGAAVVAKTAQSLRSISKPSLTWVNVGIIGVLVVGLVTYVVQTAVATSHGYIIKDLRTERIAQQEEVTQTEQRVQYLRSTGRIAEEAGSVNMVATDQAIFLEPMATGVALR